MPNLLKQLELDELSLVDRPANAQAMVSLFKRDNSQEEDMNENLEKSYDEEMKVDCPDCTAEKACGRHAEDMEKADEAAEVDARDAEIETLKAENERLRKGLIEEGYIIKAETIEKKVEPEYLEYNGEQVNKADIPAVILKALEEAEFAKADAELSKRATEALPHFAQDVAKSLVAEFGEVEAVMETLKAADAVFAENMKEVGKSDADGEFATAADKLESLVKSYMDEKQMKKSDYAKAYAAVAKTDEGKALINKSYKGE